MSKEDNSKITTSQAVLASGILIALAILGSSFIKKDATEPAPTNQVGEDLSVVIDEQELLGNVIPLEVGVDHVRGNPEGGIIVYEYSDFDCPFCGRFHTSMQRIVENYSDDVAWVYRHLPLDGLHEEAKPKAIASECVFQQGGDEMFWNFSDLLFTDNPQLSDIRGIVVDMGIDMEIYDACIESDETGRRVERDILNAIQTLGGVDKLSTPWSIIQLPDGELIPVSGAQPYEAMAAIIESVINN